MGFIEVAKKATESKASSFNPDLRVDKEHTDNRKSDSGHSFDPDKRVSTPFKGDTPASEYKDGNELKPNKEFTVRGFQYKTDAKGRVVSAGGQLRIKEKGRNRDDMAPMKDVGRGDQIQGKDDRGHLIALRFDGSNGVENLVPMDRKVNQKDYADLEKYLGDAVDAGKDVRMKVDVKYKGESNRPSSFRVKYSIDGEKGVITFKNRSS